MAVAQPPLLGATAVAQADAAAQDVKQAQPYTRAIRQPSFGSMIDTGGAEARWPAIDPGGSQSATQPSRDRPQQTDHRTLTNANAPGCDQKRPRPLLTRSNMVAAGHPSPERPPLTLLGDAAGVSCTFRLPEESRAATTAAALTPPPALPCATAPPRLSAVSCPPRSSERRISGESSIGVLCGVGACTIFCCMGVFSAPLLRLCGFWMRLLPPAHTQSSQATPHGLLLGYRSSRQRAAASFRQPLIPAGQKPQQANRRVAASTPRHSLIACCALSLLVAARKMSPGLAAGMLLLRVEVLVLAMLPDASDMASESCDADSLLVAALTKSAALGAVAAAAEEACCCRATTGACGTQQHEQRLPSVWGLGCGGLFLQVATASLS